MTKRKIINGGADLAPVLVILIFMNFASRARDRRWEKKHHLTPALSPNCIGGEGDRGVLVVRALVGVFNLMPLTPALSPSDGAREKRLDDSGCL